jgi:SOS-response transcriptional repressor LexA
MKNMKHYINKDRLKEARGLKGLSQAELAEKLHVTQAAIQSLEVGRVRSATFLVELASCLEVRPEWLIDTSDIKLFPHQTLGAIAQNIPILTIEQVNGWIHQAILPPNARMISMYNNLIKVSEKTFAIEIEGDSMVSKDEPAISLFPGHLAIIDPEHPANVGDFVLIETGKEDFKIRQFIKDGTATIFKPLNDRYPLIENKENISIAGTLIVTQQYRIPLQKM